MSNTIYLCLRIFLDIAQVDIVKIQEHTNCRKKNSETSNLNRSRERFDGLNFDFYGIYIRPESPRNV